VPLKTLDGITEIGGFKVVEMDKLKELYPEKFDKDTSQMDYEWFEKEIRPNNFIYVRHDVNSISFTIQNGPIKEAGVNGCQVDTLIETAKIMIESLNKNFPCEENKEVLEGLEYSLCWLNKRKEDRTKRNVEGLSKK